jgi:hypothetical protein
MAWARSHSRIAIVGGERNPVRTIPPGFGSTTRSFPRRSASLSTDIVIVQYNHVPADDADRKVISRGGLAKSKLPLINAGVYHVPARFLEELARDPGVAFITPDRAVHAHNDQAIATIGPNLSCQFSVNGSGIGVADRD